MYRILTKNKKIKWIELYSDQKTYNDKPAIFGTFIDISDKKNKEVLLISKTNEAENYQKRLKATQHKHKETLDELEISKIKNKMLSELVNNVAYTYNFNDNNGELGKG